MNVAKILEVKIIWEFKNCNFLYIFLNWIISVIYGANFIKFGTLIVEDYSEGTVSQIFYLGSSFHFMKSRKFSCKKW